MICLGRCYNCGDYGHRKFECPKSAAGIEQTGEEEEEDNVHCLETVWTIGEINAVRDAAVEAACTEPPPGLSSRILGPREVLDQRRLRRGCRLGCSCGRPAPTMG